MSTALLFKNIQALIKQLNWLERSLDICKKIGNKADFTLEELDRFETLTGRFSRSIDFLVRKVFRSLDDIEFENQGTLIDVVNNAHKRGLFKNIEDIGALRDLRNDIVHEYLDESLKENFSELLELTPKLIEIIKTTINYSGKYI
jgi:uncharacterized protein YutE (UPF0331/DUF86 family)